MALYVDENELPFSVYFKEVIYNNEKISKVECFSDNIEYDDRCVVIKELHEVSVNFITKENSIPQNAALFMDLFDVLDSVEYDREMEMPYVICPSETFLYTQSEGKRSYPIVPGKYRMVIKWGENIYYSYFKIDPIHISEEELDVMRMDLENTCRGLARDIILTNNTSYCPIFFESEDLFELEKFNYINKNFLKMQYSLNDIKEQPLFNLNKKYAVKPYHLSKRIDEKSCRWLQSYRGQASNEGSFNKPQYVLTSTIGNEYDISANIWIKKIVKFFVRVLGESRECIEKYELFFGNIKTIRKKYNAIYQFANDDIFLNTIENGMKNIDEWKKKIIDMTSFFENFMNSINFKDISENKNADIPSILTKDSRYNFLYRVYKMLNNPIQEHDNELIKFQWKYTDIIYEYWCYIKTIQCLCCIGYVPMDGWIYKNKYSEERIIPFIDDGESVILSKDNITLNVVFNDTYITHKRDAIKENKLVWSLTSHNKPDIHIDIYKDNKFRYSVIIDSKYRNPNGFWKDRKAMRHQYKSTAAMEQLTDYATRYYFTEEDDDDLKRNAIKKVIAVCPIPKRVNEILEYESDLAIICLNPSIGIQEFSEYLDRIIK